MQENFQGFDCSKCKHCKDKTDIGDLDLERYYLLLWAIFKPDLYRKYRAMESVRAQLIKTSDPGRPGAEIIL
ncbi:MAG: hypothetical protein QME06_08255 [Desulfobacterales bacterium]|nr:hypothetical protein [Desulfobacterales bacterium]